MGLILAIRPLRLQSLVPFSVTTCGVYHVNGLQSDLAISHTGIPCIPPIDTRPDDENTPYLSLGMMGMMDLMGSMDLIRIIDGFDRINGFDVINGSNTDN